MKKEGDSDGKRIRRILALHQILRSGRAYATDDLRKEYYERTKEIVENKTLQNDLRFMRLELGAPLPEKANKHRGYFYESTYSILEALDESYYGSLNEAVALLRQVSNSQSTEFMGLEDILLRLEQRISVTDAEKNAFIEFEEVELKGKNLLPKLHRLILKKQFLRIEYHPFSNTSYTRHVFPLLLKEYNKRWFLIAWEQGKDKPQNLPLDRIENVRETYENFVFDKRFDVRQQFRDMIGVTLEGTLETVVLKFSESRFPFILTKKLHHSQLCMNDGTISIQVYTNRELISKILEFGMDVEVIAPLELRKRIEDNLKNSLQKYHTGEDVEPGNGLNDLMNV